MIEECKKRFAELITSQLRSTINGKKKEYWHDFPTGKVDINKIKLVREVTNEEASGRTESHFVKTFLMPSDDGQMVWTFECHINKEKLIFREIMSRHEKGHAFLLELEGHEN